MILFAPHHRVRRAVVALLTVALGACAGTTGSDLSAPPTTPAPTAVATTALDEVGLSTGEVATLGRVELTQIHADDAGGLQLRLSTDDSDIGIPIFVDGATLYFLAPMSPDDPMGGGQLELYLERDGTTGPMLRLDVEPMPDAPGAWLAFVDAFINEIDTAASGHGTTFAELQTIGFDAIDPSLIPLKLTQSYLDDGSSSDLESVWNAEQLTDEGRQLLDAITAAMGLGSTFDSAEGLQSIMAPRSLSIGPAPLRSVSGSTTSATRSLRSAPIGGACVTAGISISGADELSALISTAKTNTLSPDGPRRDVLDKIGTVTTVGGFIPAAGWVIAAGGAAFVALETYLNGTAGLYPSSLSALETEINLPAFPEDFTIDGSWTTVTVTAQSTGWTADADIARTVLSTMSTATSGLAGVKVADGLALDVSLYLRDNAVNGIVSETAQDGGLLTFCPQSWQVDVTGEPWSRGRAVLSRFEVDSALRNYRPTETGLNLPVDDTLRVEVDPAAFAGESAWQDHTITVKPIRLSAPAVVEIAEPGDEIELQASVTNATNPELSWEAGQGGWRGDARLIEAGAILDVPAVWERTHATPSSTSDFPYLITLEATASTGLRADGEPPRRAVVEVRLKELVIEPDPGGVLVNRSIQFVARGADGNVADVTWSATGGTIDANGVYTAGKRPGTYTVTAVSKIDLNIRATATVIVGEADCIAGTWRLRSQDFLDQIGQAVGEPGAYQHLGGEYVVVMSDDGGFRGERRTWQFAVAALGQQLEVTINSVEIGTWSIDAANRTMTIDESSSDATVSMTVNGRELPIGTQAIQSPALSGAATYECDGDVLTTTITDAGTEITATLDRIG